MVSFFRHTTRLPENIALRRFLLYFAGFGLHPQGMDFLPVVLQLPQIHLACYPVGAQEKR